MRAVPFIEHTGITILVSQHIVFFDIIMSYIADRQ